RRSSDLVFLLCIAIVVVAAISFYWLQSITRLIPSHGVKIAITILFWTFTIGLVSAILLLKIKMSTVPITKRQNLISSLYGITVSLFFPIIIFIIIISIINNFILNYKYTNIITINFFLNLIIYFFFVYCNILEIFFFFLKYNFHLQNRLLI